MFYRRKNRILIVWCKHHATILDTMNSQPQHQIQAILSGVIAIAGLILLLMDLANMTIHMRGADSITGAILLGAGVIGLRCNSKSKQE